MAASPSSPPTEDCAAHLSLLLVVAAAASEVPNSNQQDDNVLTEGVSQMERIKGLAEQRKLTEKRKIHGI
uniref:Uncharacterized protein n=1 Tax=Oryza glumipatula TaxID=40148 RepID=A0A0D9Y6A8_9ORYZ